MTDSAGNEAGKRVVVAMSGGVDSSAAAKLLVDEGYLVLGATMRLATNGAASADHATTGDQKDAAGSESAANGEDWADTDSNGLTPDTEDQKDAAGSESAANGEDWADTDSDGLTSDTEDQKDVAGSESAANGEDWADTDGNGLILDTEDQKDAAEVAQKLGFPFRVLDFGAEFEREVVEPFCQAYLAGQTPNPCVTCNKCLKFGAMQAFRQEIGYDYIATGHYVRRAWSEERGRFLLLRGIDEAKDQSYFLYHLSQETLAHTLFPLGDRTKAEIREMARACGMAVADKPESQDICFIKDGDYAAFIEQHEGRSLEPGPIRNTQGEVVGRHEGLARYTIGQRKGLRVAYSEPLFVLAKDAEDNALIVGTAAEQGVREIWADDINLIACDDLPDYVEVQVKAMYRQKPVAGRARVEGDLLHVVLETPIKACAPGQALVVYDGDIVVGGGTIL